MEPLDQALVYFPPLPLPPRIPPSSHFGGAKRCQTIALLMGVAHPQKCEGLIEVGGGGTNINTHLLTRKPKATLLDWAATLARVLLRVKASGRQEEEMFCATEGCRGENTCRN